MSNYSLSYYLLNMAIGKREQQKQETRKRILDVAYTQFAERGIEETKTADIASAAQLSHGALFVHFKTREDIVFHVIDRFGLRLSEEIDRKTSRSRKAKSILMSFVATLAEYEAFYTELVLIAPKLPDSVQSALFMVQNGFSNYLLPSIRREMDPERSRQLSEPCILNAWFGLLHYYLMNRKWYVKDGLYLSQKGEEIVNQYLLLLNIK